MRTAESGIAELHKVVDTLLIIPNQNLFRVANEKTTFADAFAMADQVLYSGVACITDLMVKEGLINLDFADVRAVMREMGKAMMGTGEATGREAGADRGGGCDRQSPDRRFLDEGRARPVDLDHRRQGPDAVRSRRKPQRRIREEVDHDANIIVGATFDETLDGVIRVSVVATGIEQAALARNISAPAAPAATPSAAPENRLAELTAKLRADNARIAERARSSRRRLRRARPLPRTRRSAPEQS